MAQLDLLELLEHLDKEANLDHQVQMENEVKGVSAEDLVHRDPLDLKAHRALKVRKETLADVEIMDLRETRAGPDDLEVKVCQDLQVTVESLDLLDHQEILDNLAPLDKEDCQEGLENQEESVALETLESVDHLETMDQREVQDHQDLQDHQGLSATAAYILQDQMSEEGKAMTPTFSMTSLLRTGIACLLV